MKFDPNRPVQTRDGRNARIVCQDMKGRQPLLALIMQADGETEVSFSFGKNGNYKFDPDREHPFDLVNVPVKMNRWINLYRSDDGTLIAGALHMSLRDAADIGGVKGRGASFVCTTPISWEE